MSDLGNCEIIPADRLKLLRMRPFVKAARETEQLVQRAVRESKVLSLAFSFVGVEGEHQRTRVGCFILAFSVEGSNGMRDAGVGAVGTFNSRLLLLMWAVGKLLSFLSLGFPIWKAELSLATTKTKDDALR